MTDTNTGSFPKETGIRITLKRYLGPDGVIMILLVLLAIVGIGITDFSPLLSHWYWLAMVVVWLSVLVAVNLVYFLFHSGRLDSENTGLVILLILALATFLAGMSQDWRLCLLGVLLGGALILATYLEEFLWIILMVVLTAAAGIYFMARYKPASENNNL
jgi:hypothetical protein